MEGYLQEEDMEYTDNRYVYEMIGNTNKEWNMEHDYQQVYNVGIDDDSHVDNVSVFVNRQENSWQRFSLCQTAFDHSATPL